MVEPGKTTYTGGMTLEEYIWNYMPTPKKLTAQQAADVTAYVMTLPSAVRGKALYESATQGCAVCHGANGSGGLSKLPLKTSDLINFSGFATVDALAAYISTDMPKTYVTYKNTTVNTTNGSCNTACGLDIAKYIWSTFP